MCSEENMAVAKQMESTLNASHVKCKYGTPGFRELLV